MSGRRRATTEPKVRGSNLLGRVRPAVGEERGVAHPRTGYPASIDRFSLIVSLAGSVVLTIVAVILIGAGGLSVLTFTGIIGIVLLIEEDLTAWPRPRLEPRAGRRAAPGSERDTRA